jgi:beta-lactamase class A
VPMSMTEKKEIKKIAIARSLLALLLAASFATGVFIGAGMRLFAPFSTAKNDVAPEVRREGAFRFIRESLDVKDAPGQMVSKELKPFQYKVNALIEDMLKQGDVATVSVYFRDLNNGNWFGIKEHDKFSPRSLLKIPLMVAYFKWAETNPLVLRKTLTSVNANVGTDEVKTGPATKLGPEQSHTVNDLIYRMIAHDDAVAYALLLTNLPARRLEKIFKDLYVEYDPHAQDDSLSMNAFAAFYRVLFNASYLSEEMSEKALRYLSKSVFRDGMSSGIPPNIEIASKYGQRSMTVEVDGEEKEVTQVHEFGIIYHPNRPFLLGIMARGDDFEKLVKAIRDITRLVYNEVDTQSQPTAN